ncbi:MAG: ABC-three component system protein [Methylobacter sp.]
MHPHINLVPEEFSHAAIKWLHGYITKAAIDNSKIWQININDFHRDMRHTLSKFTTDKIPFHFIPKSDIEPDIIGQEFEFISKMKDVELRKKEQELAVSDYLRAKESQLKMLKSSPTLDEKLEQYDENVQRVMVEEKSSKSYNLMIEEIGSDKANKESRELFFNCIRRPHDQIIGVNDAQKYYRDGRIHHIAEESDFEWKYREADL